jgi:MFS superfamily sulfate permease-like transporter
MTRRKPIGLVLPGRSDLIASLVVFIIAVPLSLGIAMASGASPGAGLLTAIFGGVLAGSLAGAPLVVTGPAAGLTALVFQLVQEHGIAGLAIITVLCGVFQFAMGNLRAGRLFTLIPLPVLEGVLSAIGLVIVLGQLHVLMGADVPKSPVLAFTTLPDTLAGVLQSAQGWFAPVVFCGLLAIAIQMTWPKLFRKLAFLPAALPAVIFVTLVSLLWEMPRVEIAPILPTVREKASEFFAFEWVTRLGTYLFPALGVAIVASAETLLTARAVDTLVSTRPGFKPADLNRELIGQGTANMASGILGGLPMTGVMVRSAANINSGGQTRWSTILHGVWIALFVGALPFVLTSIPLTSLAAVLILTGVKLINLKHFIHTFQGNWFAGSIWLYTTIAVFATDLLTGLVVSLATYAVLKAKAIVRAFQDRGWGMLQKS